MATIPAVTFYRADRTCAIVPHSILLNYDIPFTPVPMRPSSDRLSTGSRYVAVDGSLSHEDYLAINPTGFVPALAVREGAGVTTITEMPAVLTYIASLQPELRLLGNGSLEEAKVAEWMAWLSGTLHSHGFGGYLREGRFVDDEAAFPVVKRNSKKVIEKSFARIEEMLKRKEFAVGDGLTVVDFNLYPFWRWASMLGFDLERFPTYAAHMKKIENLDGVRKALLAEASTPCFE